MKRLIARLEKMMSQSLLPAKWFSILVHGGDMRYEIPALKINGIKGCRCHKAKIFESVLEIGRFCAVGDTLSLRQ
jgi:hypothetical protein